MPEQQLQASVVPILARPWRRGIGPGLAAFGAVAVLAACGQRGPLVLPPSAQAPVVKAASTPSSAPAAALPAR